MRHIYMYLFFLLTLFSCNTISYDGEFSKDGVFTDKPQVYFFQTSDSDTLIRYSFGSKGIDVNKHVVNIPVKYAGIPPTKEMKFRVSLDVKNTTAKEGIHYTKLNTEYSFQAGKVDAVVPLELLRDSLSHSESTPLQITINIEASDDYGISFKNFNKKVVVFDNYLNEPYWWVYYTPYFGSYSRLKYLKMLEYYDYDENKLLNMFSDDFNHVALSFKKVYKFFQDHPEYGVDLSDVYFMINPFQ